jgi:hypothetical protein
VPRRRVHRRPYDPDRFAVAQREAQKREGGKRLRTVVRGMEALGAPVATPQPHGPPVERQVNTKEEEMIRRIRLVTVTLPRAPSGAHPEEGRMS